MLFCREGDGTAWNLKKNHTKYLRILLIFGQVCCKLRLNYKALEDTWGGGGGSAQVRDI